MAAAPKKRHFVIVGGGIMGCTTAYFLTRHPSFHPDIHRVTILEASTVAAGASGKAGGLLALWAFPSCLVELSFKLHAELAAEHGGEQKWGYRANLGVGTLEAQGKTPEAASQPTLPVDSPQHVKAPAGLADNLPIPPPEKASESGRQWEAPPFQNEAARSNLTADSIPTDLNWFDRDCVKAWHDMAIPGTKNHTAQVHPYYFTTSIASLAKDAGVNIIEGAKVTDIRCHAKKGVEAVVYEQRSIGNSESTPGSPVEINDVTDLVVCAGPWTGRLIPKSHIETRRAHSVVYEADVTPYAIFTNIELPSDFIPQHRKEKGQPRIHNELVDPEVYARPFGEVYACGETDTRAPLPETADLVEVDKDACDDITAYFSTISPALRNAPIKARQACYLPSHTRFGRERSPLVGRTGTPGLYLAAGHTCWGIQNGPATGKLMSELLLDGRTKSAKIDELDPRKFQVSAGLARG